MPSFMSKNREYLSMLAVTGYVMTATDHVDSEIQLDLFVSLFHY